MVLKALQSQQQIQRRKTSSSHRIECRREALDFISSLSHWNDKIFYTANRTESSRNMKHFHSTMKNIEKSIAQKNDVSRSNRALCTSFVHGLALTTFWSCCPGSFYRCSKAGLPVGKLIGAFEIKQKWFPSPKTQVSKSFLLELFFLIKGIYVRREKIHSWNSFHIQGDSRRTVRANIKLSLSLSLFVGLFRVFVLLINI